MLAKELFNVFFHVEQRAVAVTCEIVRTFVCLLFIYLKHLYPAFLLNNHRESRKEYVACPSEQNHSLPFAMNRVSANTIACSFWWLPA